MARFSRRTSRVPARRTNWIGRSAIWSGAIAQGNTGAATLIDVTDAASELSRYVSPTLIRIRGTILVDADVDLTQATNNLQVAAGIWCEDAVFTGFSADNLGRDSLLWFDALGLSTDTLTVAGTESNDTHTANTFHHLKFNIDTRAMRKLEDSKKVFLNIFNLGTVAGGADLAYSYFIRLLIKE